MRGIPHFITNRWGLKSQAKALCVDPNRNLAPRTLRESKLLNKFGPSGLGEAQVQYLDGDFRVTSPGTYVKCAVTGVQIPLDELKYWSVDLKEAYASPTAVVQRHYPHALKP
jgi:hypothetical protein